MTVGETLTEARHQAGLSVEELSDRTKIRGTVIQSIEHDDYEACGGDIYVRGYVRAIAGAVGIDAQPLIREYDEERASGQTERANGSTGRHARGFEVPAATDSAATRFDLAAVPAVPAEPADPDATAYDLPAVAPLLPPGPAPADPAAVSASPGPASPVPASTVPPPAAQPPGSADTRFDLPAVTDDMTADDLMAAGYDIRPAGGTDAPGSATSILPALGTEPPGPAGPGGPPPATGPGRAPDGKNRRVLAAPSSRW